MIRFLVFGFTRTSVTNALPAAFGHPGRATVPGR
ncbi:hypothetical protein BX283_3963 [Streptomyces sp. TLI_146]|nr:hypothetical protein BX283_3963 [Streptomyces sp. TLI_146]